MQGVRRALLRNSVTGGGATLRTGPERRGGGGGTRRKAGRFESDEGDGKRERGGGQRRSITLRRAALQSLPSPLDCSYSHTYSCCFCCCCCCCWWWWSPHMYAYMNLFGPPPPLMIALLIGSHKTILLHVDLNKRIIVSKSSSKFDLIAQMTQSIIEAVATVSIR